MIPIPRKRCPKCRAETHWSRLFRYGFPGMRWRCHGCGAMLRWDIWRHRLVVVPFTILMLALGGLSTYLLPRFPIEISEVLTVILIMVFFFAAQRVLISPGPTLCDCGYDLTGNTSDVCPECGNKFELRPNESPRRGDGV